jgi:hypothetical protein
LAIRTASSSSSNGISTSTGPNTSCCAIAAELSTPTTTVGATKCPPARCSGNPSTAPPPTVISAPLRRAPSIADNTRSFCAELITGPTSVPESTGSPTGTY